MRITDSMMITKGTYDASRARERTEVASAQVSSGLRVVHPSDDGAASALAIQAQQMESQFSGISLVLTRVNGELEAADNSLSSIETALSRARELTIQLLNPTYQAAERAAGGVEATGLVQTIIGQLNNRVGNRYIFGGNLDDKPPFDAAGTYLGDDGVRLVEVAPGMRTQASVRADLAIVGTNGGVDVLKTLNDMATAMTNNDVNGLKGVLDNLDTSIAQVARYHAQLGGTMSLISNAQTTNQTAIDWARAQRASLIDADAIESMSQLTLSQRALDAALTATSTSFRFTLLSKL